MKRLIVLAAIAALVPASAPALAQVRTITDKPGIVGTDGKKVQIADGRWCKTLVVTGSRLPTKKVCKTEEEWEAQAQASRDKLDDFTRLNNTTNKIAGAEGG
jgi:hypothetical protein